MDFGRLRLAMQKVAQRSTRNTRRTMQQTHKKREGDPMENNNSGQRTTHHSQRSHDPTLNARHPWREERRPLAEGQQQNREDLDVETVHAPGQNGSQKAF